MQGTLKVLVHTAHSAAATSELLPWNFGRNDPVNSLTSAQQQLLLSCHTAMALLLLPSFAALVTLLGLMLLLLPLVSSHCAHCSCSCLHQLQLWLCC